MKKEYRIIAGPFTNVQKTLNQWKDIYEIKVLKMVSISSTEVAVLIVRMLTMKPEKTIFEE